MPFCPHKPAGLPALPKRFAAPPCPRSRREAALAWEAAFVRLASTRLAAMAEGAGLRLSFSTERSVQDELSRESTSGGRLVLLLLVFGWQL